MLASSISASLPELPDDAAPADVLTILADTDTVATVDAEPEPAAPLAVDSVGGAVVKPEQPAPRGTTRAERAAMSREEFFQLAFGTPGPTRVHNFTARLFSEGRGFGDAEIQYDSAFTSFHFTSPVYARFLDGLLLPEARREIGAEALGGRFSSALLESLGYTVELIDREHTLRVRVPPEKKGLQRTNLGRGNYEPLGEEIKPAHWSFYVNAGVSESFSHVNYRYSDPGANRTAYSRRPLVFDFDGALSAYGVYLESSAQVNESAPGQFSLQHVRRGDTWLTCDYPRHLSRLTLGDVKGGGVFMGGEVMGGLRYERSERFFRNDPYESVNSISFFMPRAGYVEIHTDGEQTRRLDLPAGYHEISGFSGQTGRNDVMLVLYMEDGSVREILFEFTIGSPRAMVKGETRYAVTQGFRRYSVPQPRSFDYDPEPGISADIIYGLFHTMSAGIGAQLSLNNRVGGALIMWDLYNFGFISAQGYANYADSSSLGARADLTYSIDLDSMMGRLFSGLISPESKLKNVRFTFTGYLQSAFCNQSMFSSHVNAHSAMAGVAGGFGFGLPSLSISANGGVVFNREIEGVEYSPLDYRYGLWLSPRLGAWSVSASAGADVTNGIHRPFFSLNASYAFWMRNSHNIRIAAGTDMRTAYTPPETRPAEHPDFDGQEDEVIDEGYKEHNWSANGKADWSWSNGVIGRGEQRYTANLVFMDKDLTGGATARYSYNRAELLAGYDGTHAWHQDYGRHSHALRARLGASLMYAGGLWAVGRPTNGNFVLVDTRGNLDSATVHIGRSRDREHSRSGRLGAAYHNRLSEYSPTEIILRLSDVPAGAWLERNLYHVNGTYKQGYALRVGSEKQAFASVRLTTDGGSPLSHTYASIEPEDPDDAYFKRDTFTNSDGVLQLGLLTPGRSYRIKFNPATYIKDIILLVPGHSEAVYDLGVIEVEKE